MKCQFHTNSIAGSRKNCLQFIFWLPLRERDRYMHTLYFAESLDLAKLCGTSGFEFEM